MKREKNLNKKKKKKKQNTKERRRGGGGAGSNVNGLEQQTHGTCVEPRNW